MYQSLPRDARFFELLLRLEGFLLRVDDFATRYERMVEAGVTFVRPPRKEPYGEVAVFLDVAGNRWDLLGPTC